MTDIRMPDGQVVRFPDDMPREQIDTLIKQKYPEHFAKSFEGFGSNLVQNAQDIGERLTTAAGKAWKDPAKGMTRLGEAIAGPIVGAYEKLVPGRQYAEKFFDPYADMIGEDLAIGKFAKTGAWDPSQAYENFYNRPLDVTLSALGLAPGLQAGRGILGRAARGVDRAATFPINAAGKGVTSVAKRAVTPMPTNPAVTQRAQWLEQEIGHPVSAGQYLDSPNLKWVEEAYGGMDHTPTKQAFTRRAARDAGIHQLNDIDMLDPQTLARRYDQFQAQFQSFHVNNTLQRTPQFAIDADRAFREFARHSGANINMTPQQLAAAYRGSEGFNVAQQLANGTLTGGQYHMLRSAWAKASSSGENQALRAYYHDLVEALDDVAAQSMPAAERARFAALRREYRNFKALEHAMGPGGDADTAAGLVTPRRLESGAGRGKFRGSYTRGGSDYTRLAKAGKSVIGNQPPQTGSWPRNFMNKLAAGAGGLGGAGVGTAAGFGMGGPVGAGLGAALGAGAGLLGQIGLGKAIRSRTGQNWLKNQRLRWDTQPVRDAGIAAGIVGRQAVRTENIRQRNIEKAETVLSKDIVGHVKRTPKLRGPFNEWLNKNDAKSLKELARAIAADLKVPDMAARIEKELGGQ